MSVVLLVSTKRLEKNSELAFGPCKKKGCNCQCLHRASRQQRQWHAMFFIPDFKSTEHVKLSLTVNTYCLKKHASKNKNNSRNNCNHKHNES